MTNQAKNETRNQGSEGERTMATRTAHGAATDTTVYLPFHHTGMLTVAEGKLALGILRSAPCPQEDLPVYDALVAKLDAAIEQAERVGH